jgi:diguanylate cyclase (GGDEF)-like protein
MDGEALDFTIDAAGKRRVLVVDGSRVVRATLAKRLEDGFGVVEEDNGESAWQRLMLDSSIVAVVSSPSPPRLKALDLLERMRASALRRLRETPMVLLASDDTPDARADEWRNQGVAGLMTKSMSRETMTERLEAAISPMLHPAPQDTPREEAHAEIPEEAPEKPRAGQAETATTPLLDAEDFVAAVASLPHEMGSEEPLCVLVFGIDRLGELIGNFGADVPDVLIGRIAKLLAAKIDPRDVLGRRGEDRVAIVSHGVDLRAGVHFGRRVCKSMATGQITIHGRKARLTTSVGVAATSDDHVASPEDLLALAQERLKQAMVCGGNSVCTELRPNCSLSQRDEVLLELFHLLGEVLEPAQKNALGIALRPLLLKIGTKLAGEAKQALGLPKAD